MGAEMAPWTEWNDAASLPWHLLDHAPHRGVRDLLVSLNAQADRWPAVWERDHEHTSFQWLDADDTAHSIYAFIRWAEGGAHAVVCIANFTPVPRPGYRVGLPWAGAWQVVVDTDAAPFGGSGYGGGAPSVDAVDHAWQGRPTSALVDLPPLAVVWLAAHRPV
jgi:1,4-alpha-glucan branching enzyme